MIEKGLGVKMQAEGRNDVERDIAQLTRSLQGYGKAVDEADKESARLGGHIEEIAKRSKGTAEEVKGIVTPLEELRSELGELRKNTALDVLKLQSKEYRQAVKEAGKAQRELDRLTDGFGKRTKEFLEGGENVKELAEGLNLAREAAIKLWEAMKGGAAAADIEATLSRLHGAASGRQIAAAAGGQVTGVEAGRLSARASDKGLSAAQSEQIASLAAIAAQKEFALEGGNIQELTNEFARSLQDELAAGQLGDAFQKIGINQAEYDQALRKEAQARGVAIDSLSQFSREMILVSQANRAGALTATLYHQTLSAGAARFEVDLQNFRDQVGKALTSGLGEAGVKSAALRVAAAQFQVSQFEAAASRANAPAASPVGARQRAESGLGAGGGSSAAASRAAQALLRAERELAEAERRLVAERSAAITTALEKSLPKIAADLEQLGQGGDVGLERINDALDIIIFKKDQGLSLDDASLDTAVELISKSKLMSAEQGRHLLAEGKRADLEKLKATLQGEQVKILQQHTQARLQFLRNQLRINEALDAQTRLQTQQKIIELEQKEAALAVTTTRNEALELLNEERQQALITVRQEKARATIEAEKRDLMTEQERAMADARVKALELKEQAIQHASSLEEARDLLARRGIVHWLDEGGSAAKLLQGTIGTWPGLMGKATDAAASFVSVLDQAAGGSILSTENLAKTFLPKEKEKEKPKRKRSGGGRSGREDLLKRAELAGVEDLERQRLLIERQFEKDLKTARKVKKLIEAANKIRDEALEDLAVARASAFRASAVDAAKEMRASMQARVDLVEQARRSEMTEHERALEDNQRALEARLEIAAGNQRAEQAAWALHFRSLAEIETRFADEREQRLQEQAERERARIDDEFTALQESRQVQFEAFAEMQQQTDALMGEFSGENVNQTAAEILQATDVVLAAGAAINDAGTEILEIQRQYEQSQITAQQAIAGQIGSTLGAFSAVTGALVKNMKVRAGIEGGIEVARSIAAFATPNIPKGIAHAAAATKFFAIAGGGAGVAKANVAKKQERQRNQRTQLSRTVLPFNSRFGGQQQINLNFFSSLDRRPPGDMLADALNATARERRGVKLDGGLLGGRRVSGL